MSESRGVDTSAALASVAITLGTVSLVVQRLSEGMLSAYLRVIDDYDTRRALEQVPTALDPIPPALINLDRGVWVLAIGGLLVALTAVVLIPRRSLPWRLSLLALILALITIWAQWDFMNARRWSRPDTPLDREAAAELAAATVRRDVQGSHRV